MRDLNDCYPKFEMDVYTVNITEDTENGTAILTVNATDDDVDGNPFLSLTSISTGWM